MTEMAWPWVQANTPFEKEKRKKINPPNSFSFSFLWLIYPFLFPPTLSLSCPFLSLSLFLSRHFNPQRMETTTNPTQPNPTDKEKTRPNNVQNTTQTQYNNTNNAMQHNN